ncbi:MAG: ATP-dependent DNA ligase [Deltaproteobacteria bacterium]|nr:ATP-dependent DNA ligase [Deltaproteobacteria bacterium]
MTLPLAPPLKPMLAKAAKKLPRGDTWIYEPKWDGFRVVVFRDGDELYLQSRSLKPLLRYFPELREPLLAALPERCIVDGELVVERNGRLSFDSLQMRLHPAKSRIDKLAAECPTQVVFFDLIALGDTDLSDTPFVQRREMLEQILQGVEAPVYVTPATTDRVVAEDWFHRFEGAGFDGVIAKGVADGYMPGKRTMVKIKHERTADCVVAGFRWHKNGPGELVGSLILALWDGEKLQQIGVAASFTAARRAELVEELAPYREGALEGHPWADWAKFSQDERRPGQQSRWNGGKDLSWQPLRLGLVAEVGFNQFDGGRLRHPGHFKRWRPDKEPADCTYEQMEVIPPQELSEIFGG